MESQSRSTLKMKLTKIIYCLVLIFSIQLKAQKQYHSYRLYYWVKVGYGQWAGLGCSFRECNTSDFLINDFILVVFQIFQIQSYR